MTTKQTVSSKGYKMDNSVSQAHPQFCGDHPPAPEKDRELCRGLPVPLEEVVLFWESSSQAVEGLC